MTTYNTGNALGSPAVKDLFDNAENLDTAVNDVSTENWADRLGKVRKTYHGMEMIFGRFLDSSNTLFQGFMESSADEFSGFMEMSDEAFQQFLLSSGYDDLGDYAAGIVLTARNQVFARDGNLYRVAASVALPYTTTGAWESESTNFVIVGDNSLRQQLADPDLGGGSLVGVIQTGAGAGVRSVQEKSEDIVSPMDYEAAGDGVDGDTAAFVKLEAAVTGKVVDLARRIYVVDQEPTKNAYVNGVFLVGGFPQPAMPGRTFASQAPKFSAFGAQLRNLRRDLSDPLTQFVGIVFIGDSITWGSGATGAGSGAGRDGTLSDPRATYGCAAYVNQFKRHILSSFRRGDGMQTTVSNWPASGSGESTVQYKNRELLYPHFGDFTVARLGASQEPGDLATNNSPSGMILSLNHTVNGAQYGHSVKFPFTGSSFTLAHRIIAATSTYYDVLINGNLLGTFSTHVGDNGFVDDPFNYAQLLTHSFPYVRDAEIEIRTNRNGETGQRLVSLTALYVDRTVRITNQGIVGLSSVSYRTQCLENSTDGAPVGADDQYVFCQLGTNDRGWVTGRPRGSNQFYVNLKLLLDALPAGKDLILMCANPAANEDRSVYPFHMQEVRNVVQRVARERSIAFIDNYTPYLGLHTAAYTADGLHPNDLGHTIMAWNIINALEQS